MPRGEPYDSWREFQKSDYYCNQNQKDQDICYARFCAFFTQKNIGAIPGGQLAEETREFLRDENNRHWGKLDMWGNAGKVCKNPNLRRAILSLLDEKVQIAVRLDEANSLVPGLGKATATPILLVAYPYKYGVWNASTEAGMKLLKIWPPLTGSLGRQYGQLNKELDAWARALETDLWTLDHLWQFKLDGGFYEGGWRKSPCRLTSAARQPRGLWPNTPRS